jgi:hypothetical protein
MDGLELPPKFERIPKGSISRGAAVRVAPDILEDMLLPGVKARIMGRIGIRLPSRSCCSSSAGRSVAFRIDGVDQVLDLAGKVQSSANAGKLHEACGYMRSAQEHHRKAHDLVSDVLASNDDGADDEEDPGGTDHVSGEDMERAAYERRARIARAAKLVAEASAG